MSGALLRPLAGTTGAAGFSGRRASCSFALPRTSRRLWSKALSSQDTTSSTAAEQQQIDEELSQHLARSTGATSTSNGDGARRAEQEKELVAIEKLNKEEGRLEQLLFWVGSAIAFGAGIWWLMGPIKGQEFFAGYILEQSLSIDNLFVFVLVFSYFKTPPSGQSQVLGYGIATAAVLRAVLIIAGVELVKQFEPVLIVFAAILLFSAYKLLDSGADDDEAKDDLSENEIVQFCRRFIKTSEGYDGNKFFTTLPNGARAATPLLLALAVVELSDVLFAVDSIPAVLGVTLDPFIVYTSNIFAILSLRALYSFVATVMTELRYLDKSVAVVLGFIGVKMLLDVVDIVVPTDVSLIVVGLVLGGGVAASLLLPETAEKHGKGVDPPK